MKKFYSLFAAVILAASVNAQTTTTNVTYSFGDQGFANQTVIAGGNIDENLDYILDANGANAATYYTADGLRFYSVRATGEGNIMDITPKNGAKITSLVVNSFAVGNTPAVTYSVDGGAYQAATWTGTALTISGINAASSLKIKNAHTGGSSNLQVRITNFNVTYDIVTMAEVDVNATKVNLVKNTVVGNTILFAAKADVQILNMNGQVVKTASVNENTSLEVSSLAKGMYVVTATVNGKAVSQKIIKK